nr:hypothetical protein CTI12_AA056460 [Tanacetum cinerariifolium]
MRRDVWFAFIKEVISLYQFIRNFGPKENDPSVKHVYGAQKGNTKATSYAVNGIARLQALQFTKMLLDEPTKLVQFSFLQNAPYGDIVCQTLAVNCWGGQLITRLKEIEFDDHVYDIDGGVYLRKWMRHPSWNSSASIAFWKNTLMRHALILSKNLVVADKTLIEKAATTCRDKHSVVEKTQATIDAAMIEGIPSNIDLFKEIVLPLTVIAKKFGKLRRWEEPHLTASFLGFVYALIYRNLLSYIIAVKEAMRVVEEYMQSINVSLLKVRTILLAGQPQITTEVAMVLLFGSTILLTVPFKYVLSLVILDLFTQELDFRKEMFVKFISFLKARWDTVPASPVSVLPFNSNDTNGNQEKKAQAKGKSGKYAALRTMAPTKVTMLWTPALTALAATVRKHSV